MAKDEKNKREPRLTEETARLLIENRRQFRRFLAKRLGSESDADEVLQQSLRKAVEHPPSAVADSGVLAWFYKILRNTLIDHYRASATRRKKNDELYRYITSVADDQAAPDDVKAAICECMQRLLPSLKAEYASILERIDLRGEAADQVARELKTTRNNVEVRLHRARKALKKSLELSCGSCTTHGCLHCTCDGGSKGIPGKV